MRRRPGGRGPSRSYPSPEFSINLAAKSFVGGLVMWKVKCASAAVIAAIAFWSSGASAQSGQMIVELNKFEAIENGCRTFFLFRNHTEITF